MKKNPKSVKEQNPKVFCTPRISLIKRLSFTLKQSTKEHD